jgi:hypothetical protein
MRIPGFYRYTRQVDEGHCSDDTLTTKGTCEAAGKTWYAEKQWVDPKLISYEPDEYVQDYYWTGVHRKTFTGGIPVGYDNKKGWTTATNYEKGDFVSVPDPEGGEPSFYYCLTDHGSFSAPTESSSIWEKVPIASYEFEGKAGNLDPDAFHLLNTEKRKIQDWYELGKHDSAKKQEEFKAGDNQFHMATSYKFDTYETCHGTTRIYNQGHAGEHNFYNATYPAGYFAPPFGETPTLTLYGPAADGGDLGALGEGQIMNIEDFALGNFTAGNCCKKLDDPEELDMWGIRTVFPTRGTALVTTDSKRGDEHGIHAPSEECPPEFPPAYYFQEQKFTYHPGSIMAPGAGTYYNDNPFPNSVDTDGWINTHVYESQICYGGPSAKYLGYKIKGGFPELTYPISGTNESKLDAGICKARQCETSQLLGYNFAGVQLGAGHGFATAFNDQASYATYDPFTYWHFIYKYNHDQLWNESENTTTNKVVSLVHKEGAFDDHMWEYRQCPNTPDFLPWSQDNPITACPSDYFDIPYYAAIGKFGFYGARFFNSCSHPVSEKDNETCDTFGDSYNYYTATVVGGGGAPVTMKGLANVTSASDATVMINYNCYDLKHDRTSTDDEPTDFQISSNSPAFVTRQGSIDLQYGVYEEVFDLMDFWHMELKNTVTWKTINYTIPGGEDCVNGGVHVLDDVEDQIKAAIEGEFGKTLAELRAIGSTSQADLLRHGSDYFNVDTVVNLPFQDLASHRTLSRGDIDNIHASEGKYSTCESKVDLVRDYSAGVQDCTAYVEPSTQAGTCNTSHYEALLEIAKHEERLGEWFAGNVGFFLWTNYDHIINSYEYQKLLTGSKPGTDGETHFKKSLLRLKQDFDETLVNLPNFMRGANSPVIYYDSGGGDMFGTTPLSYSRKSALNDMLFSNNRYERFLKEISWNIGKNVLALSEQHNQAWNDLVKLYGHYVAHPAGTAAGGRSASKSLVNTAFYETGITGKEARLLTRFIENKFRGKAIDLYPTNHIGFSTDRASGYYLNEHWGNSIYSDNVTANYRGSKDPAYVAQFDPLPDVPRTYFQGVYAHKSTVTGVQHQVEIAQHQSPFFSAGFYQDFGCGGDIPRRQNTAYGISMDTRGSCSAGGHTNKADCEAAGEKWTSKIPNAPWRVVGHNDVGELDPNFSCFSPIFTQQPIDVACKIGQRPRFRCQAVDYHTIPEDKMNKGYPEIDFWTNSLKLTDKEGNSKYPIEYRWYRISKEAIGTLSPEIDIDHLFYGQKTEHDVTSPNFGQLAAGQSPDVFYLEEASVTGTWCCLEGVSGRGSEDCTLIHPQMTYTWDQTEGDDMYNIGSRKFGEEHWSKLVSYDGKIKGTSKIHEDNDYDDRLFKTFTYVQGAIANQQHEFCPHFTDNETDKKKVPVTPPYGTAKNGDDNYLYFCVASGRFGFRRSEHVNLSIEDWVKIDFSVRNGAPAELPLKTLTFEYRMVDGKQGTVPLQMGWGRHAKAPSFMTEGVIPPFLGIQKDKNQVEENVVKEYINMYNNCRSYAFVGVEGFRGTTRSFKPPTQSNIKGDKAETANWFEYGYLTPFGNKLTQEWGNSLYSQSQIPLCRNYYMPMGGEGAGFGGHVDLSKFAACSAQELTTHKDKCGKVSQQTTNTDLATLLGGIPAKPPKIRHWAPQEPAVICTSNRVGVTPTKQMHHGELYPWNEADVTYDYVFENPFHLAHGIGVTWQFANNLGAIKRFGYYTLSPKLEDDENIYYWSTDKPLMRKEFNAAKRMIRSDSLAGPNCGWREESCGRFMLYFVENLMRYWISCDAKGKARVKNKSYIAPGLRHGSSACQYFWGGTPNSTRIKRSPLVGPYAYEWKISRHNRDRNGNGIPQSFYSTKHERAMDNMYDPPAIYGLWARQVVNDYLPDIKRCRILRRRAMAAWGFASSVRYVRWGPYGSSKNGGCGAFRLGCVDTPHLPNRPSHYFPGDPKCDWYVYAKRVGMDPGWFYGCNEDQLLKGVCFDPCLSMKYNYGFFPGGKLLTINSYVRYSYSRHNLPEPKANTLNLTAASAAAKVAQAKINARAAAQGKDVAAQAIGSTFVTQISNNIDDEEKLLSKNARAKSCRIIRGPWATPYRRIKYKMTGLTADLSDGGGDFGAEIEPKEPGNYFDSRGFTQGTHFYGATNDLAVKRYADTTVSPCNGHGAEHCNFLTPTLHLGMDVELTMMAPAFGPVASEMGGRYTDMQEITLTSELVNFVDGFMSSMIKTPGAIVGGTIQTVKAAFSDEEILCMTDLLGEPLDGYLDQLVNNIGNRGTYNPTLVQKEIMRRAAGSAAAATTKGIEAMWKYFKDNDMLIQV